MKIIDAHLHLFPEDARSQAMARVVGHENSTDYLKEYYAEHDLVCGVVMGNGEITLDRHHYPAPFRYCIGLDSGYLETHHSLDEAAELVEEANNYSCDIHMSDGTHEGCDLKSIMNVFGSIVAGAGDTLHITFDGLDEVQALRGFKALAQTMKF